MSEAGFKHYLQIEASQTQGRMARAKLAQEKSEIEAQQNSAAWGKLRQRWAAEALQSQLLQLVVPSGPPRASKLTAQRRHSYREHLAKIIAEALNPPDVASPAPGLEILARKVIARGQELAALGTTSELPGRLCAMCGGGCCTQGGNEAYLTASTVRRVMAEQPRLQSAGELMALYIDRLPSKVQAGSCINHGSQGCVLTRAMRSDICNNYACEALARLQYAQRQAKNSSPQHAEIAVLVLRRKQDNWLRGTLGLDNAIKSGALLSEAGVTRVTASRLLGQKSAKRSQLAKSHKAGGQAQSEPISASISAPPSQPSPDLEGNTEYCLPSR
ncbi:hypothetical protein [Roseateles oligotrophus]|uniref:Uncharacterized protein n=1 Tax=Roseateles oligotrophus TaxID=1769250 RepID=A0ABT2YGA0_9BURK|nr:hypothetical protein [Roseateles oligotrophus]MCV2369054.1 hypothetical protein [Roseateles oligotrophus]